MYNNKSKVFLADKGSLLCSLLKFYFLSYTIIHSLLGAQKFSVQNIA
jgi:hypothetical protein